MGSLFLDASVILASEDPSDSEFAAAAQLVEGTTSIATLDLAYYETGNVATRSWQNPSAASRMIGLIEWIGRDGGVIQADSPLAHATTAIALEHGITTYDAAYVAAARSIGAQLVSCDIRDLVSKGLAILPSDVVASAQ